MTRPRSVGRYLQEQEKVVQLKSIYRSRGGPGARRDAVDEPDFRFIAACIRALKHAVLGYAVRARAERVPDAAGSAGSRNPAPAFGAYDTTHDRLSGWPSRWPSRRLSRWPSGRLSRWPSGRLSRGPSHRAAAVGLNAIHGRHLPSGTQRRSPRYAASMIAVADKITSARPANAGWPSRSSGSFTGRPTGAPAGRLTVADSGAIGAAIPIDLFIATAPGLTGTAKILAPRTAGRPAPRPTTTTSWLVPQSSLVP